MSLTKCTNFLLTINGHLIEPVVGSGPSPVPSVQIGNQIWSRKNLAIDDGGEGIASVTHNYGHGDVVDYYYTWAAAVRVAASVQGWHLPTADEFEALNSYLGTNPGQKLKSTYGWSNNGNGTDEFGFTGLPAGYYSYGTGFFGEVARFWSSTTYTSNESKAYYRRLHYSYNTFSYDVENKGVSLSVRLIKDS